MATFETRNFIWSNSGAAVLLVMSIVLLAFASAVISFVDGSSLTIDTLKTMGYVFLVFALAGIALSIASFFMFDYFHKQYLRLTSKPDVPVLKPAPTSATSYMSATSYTSAASSNPYGVEMTSPSVF